MTHELLTPTYNDELDPGHIMEKFSCSCGKWQRLYRLENALSLQEVESEHQDHRRHAGAEELRTGVQAPPEVTLESLARAMAKFAEAAVKSAEAMKEFNEAFAVAEERGIGVVVVRNADGSTTSTPNVFVPAGTAVFTDLPNVAMPIQPFIIQERITECQTLPTSDTPEISNPLKAA